MNVARWAVLAVIACLGADAQATPPIATASYAVDGGLPLSVDLVPTPNANGTASYSAVIDDRDSLWRITYAIVVDYTNNPMCSISGLITFNNFTSEVHTFKSSFGVPVCPNVSGGSLLGGMAKLTLVTSGPGSVTCNSGTPVVQMLGDGDPIGSFFYCPFQLAGTGSGISSTTTQFGLPGATEPGPTKFEEIGERQQFNLTGGDSLTVQVTLFFKDADGYVAPACPADLTHDGVVDGADMTVLFGYWGAVTSCPADLPADLDGNGTVGPSDLVVLLDNWGSCDAMESRGHSPK